jgi:hypothetical protein
MQAEHVCYVGPCLVDALRLFDALRIQEREHLYHRTTPHDTYAHKKEQKINNKKRRGANKYRKKVMRENKKKIKIKHKTKHSTFQEANTQYILNT